MQRFYLLAPVDMLTRSSAVWQCSSMRRKFPAAILFAPRFLQQAASQREDSHGHKPEGAHNTHHPDGLHVHCRHCDAHFRRTHELHDHYESQHALCKACGKIFDSPISYQQACQRELHFCKGCQRCFSSAHTLSHHLRTSSKHHTRTLQCPGSPCQKHFVSHGDTTLHCESGKCCSGLTRQAVKKLCTKYDDNEIITIPGVSNILEDVLVEATQDSWNGSAFECVLCCKTFTTLQGLNAHMQSPTHDVKGFRCPAKYHGCSKEFKTLSALLHHVERSACGVTTSRERVTNILTDISKRMRKNGLQ